MAFSDNLQFLRAQREITQEELAEQLNVSRQSVSKWESGQSFPEMDTLLRLCQLYDVNMDILLRGSVEASLVADTAQYDRFMTRQAHRIALSVGGILTGVALMLFAIALGLAELLAAALFLLILTVCVVVLVASGIQGDNFRRKYPTIQDFYTQEQRDAFHQRFVWLMAGGVGAILLGVVLLTLFFAVFPEKEFYELMATGSFLLIVAGAAGCLIYGGMQEEKYQIWKYNRDNNPTPEAQARKNLIGAICGAMMTLCAAVYVGAGLALGLWRTAWWVFAVGGILCGVVSILLNPYKGED